MYVFYYDILLSPKCDVLCKPSRSRMLLIRFGCRCSLNAKQHTTESDMVKANSGHSAARSGTALDVAAIPESPPMSVTIIPDTDGQYTSIVT